MYSLYYIVVFFFIPLLIWLTVCFGIFQIMLPIHRNFIDKIAVMGTHYDIRPAFHCSFFRVVVVFFVTHRPNCSAIWKHCYNILSVNGVCRMIGLMVMNWTKHADLQRVKRMVIIKRVIGLVFIFRCKKRQHRQGSYTSEDCFIRECNKNWSAKLTGCYSYKHVK